MFKRIALSLTFVAALMTAGLSFSTPSAQAWRYYGRPYAARYYYGPPRAYYYSPYRPYRSYSYYRYPGPYAVGPGVPYYAPYYYGSPSVYYSSPGVSVSVGL